MKLKLIAAALLASTSIAAAADMPARTYTKAPVVSPAFNWTGFYVGVHAGYGWGNSKSVATNGTLPFFPAGSVTSNDLDGWLAGGQLGYNYQFSPNWLIGIEGDMAGTGIKEDIRVQHRWWFYDNAFSNLQPRCELARDRYRPTGLRCRASVALRQGWCCFRRV